MTTTTAKPLWLTLQKELHSDKKNEYTLSIIKATKRLLLKRWLSEEQLRTEQIFYIDPRLSRCAIDIDGHTKQPTTVKGVNYDSGSRFQLPYTDFIRMGIAWKSRIPVDVDIFGRIGNSPRKTIAKNDTRWCENNEFLEIIKGDIVTSVRGEFLVKTIDLDVRKIKDGSNKEGKNEIHLGFNVHKHDDVSIFSDIGLVVEFFIQSFNNGDELTTAYDGNRSLLHIPLDALTTVFNLNDILSTTTLVSSLDFDKMEVLVHNQPIPSVVPTPTMEDKKIDHVIRRSKSQFNITDMLKVVIPLGNITSNPDEADVIIADLENPAVSIYSKVISPKYDMWKIRQLLML